MRAKGGGAGADIIRQALPPVHRVGDGGLCNTAAWTLAPLVLIASGNFYWFAHPCMRECLPNMAMSSYSLPLVRSRVPRVDKSAAACKPNQGFYHSRGTPRRDMARLYRRQLGHNNASSSSVPADVLRAGTRWLGGRHPTTDQLATYLMFPSLRALSQVSFDLFHRVHAHRGYLRPASARADNTSRRGAERFSFPVRKARTTASITSGTCWAT